MNAVSLIKKMINYTEKRVQVAALGLCHKQSKSRIIWNTGVCPFWLLPCCAALLFACVVPWLRFARGDTSSLCGGSHSLVHQHGWQQGLSRCPARPFPGHCAVLWGVPQASAAGGHPWCCQLGLGFAPVVVKALLPGRGMPMRGLLLRSPDFWAVLACCWLLYALIKSSGNLWAKGKIQNVTQSKL